MIVKFKEGAISLNPECMEDKQTLMRNPDIMNSIVCLMVAVNGTNHVAVGETVIQDNSSYEFKTQRISDVLYRVCFHARKRVHESANV
jgi:hypothetical protein